MQKHEFNQYHSKKDIIYYTLVSNPMSSAKDNSVNRDQTLTILTCSWERRKRRAVKAGMRIHFTDLVKLK